MAQGEPISENVRELGLLSVVTPMLDEEANAEAFCERVCSTLDGLDFELVVVDDGSADATARIVAGLVSSNPRIRLLRLSRTFGHQAALTAGLDHARGDAVVTIDADFQDPPEVIHELIEAWRGGADVVLAVRRSRPGEPPWRLKAIGLFYRLFGRISQISYTANSGDFRLLDRKALDVLRTMPERNRFLRGMSVWVGFEQALVEYDRDARAGGTTKYPFFKLLRLALDGVASFSHLPLQVATYLGFAFAILAFLGIPGAIIARIAGIYVPGIASVILVVCLLGGIQLITLGTIGEYIGRIYDEAKRRPVYVVSDRLNVDQMAAPVLDEHLEPLGR